MINSSVATSITPSLEETDLEGLLSYLKQVHQVDLTGYKRSGLMRRTQVRMQQVSVACYRDYLDLLKQPEEVAQLLNTIFINFTCFFRDQAVWQALQNEVLPRMIANKAPDEPIRVWSAGCASGEETYSLAMLLAEALGPEQFHRRVRIYGTDVDSDAILQARQGYYSFNAVKDIPAALLERYFERTTNGYYWRQPFCYPISFHRHNLMQFSSLPQVVDLLLCRNTLMYFTSEAQLQVLSGLHSSLKDNGFLLLGQAESLVSRSQREFFTSLNSKARLFTKVLDREVEALEGDDRRSLPSTFYPKPKLNDNSGNGLNERHAVSINSLQEDRERYRSQLEAVQHNIEQLQALMLTLAEEESGNLG